MSTRNNRRFATILLVGLCTAHVSAQLKWVAQAPGPTTIGQVENIADREVVGAVNALAPHPTNPDILYVASVNGGLWRTTNAMAPQPSWVPLTDGQQSQSFGAIEIDPTDATSSTIVAGSGRFSSLRREGGARIGVLRSTDAGKTWTSLNTGGLLTGLNIAAVVPRGATIAIGANDADNLSRVGVWRTTNTGAAWMQVSGVPTSGLPTGRCSDLASDPTNQARLYAVIGGRGLFRSDNLGEKWNKVSDTAMDPLIAAAGNAKIAVGAKGNVFVAIVVGGQLAGVFRSANSGQSWTAMELPRTSEGGAHIGGQGGIHLSIAADPTNTQIVYIGGDRQPAQFINGAESNGIFPNSIGAGDYSGRLFRGDASLASNQWAHLTHSRKLGATGGGTANSSAPHADSRDMAFAANGILLESDDGGVYKRTDPRSNNGDWFSMNGNLQATEFHSVAWDANANVVIGGAQDTGTPQQRLRSDARWQSVSTGDGGVVAVDDVSMPGLSIRYSSYQGLWDFRREVYDANNIRQARISPMLTLIGTGNPLVPGFYSPIRLNTIAPRRLIIGAANSVYESLDEGDTVSEIGPGIVANEQGSQIIAYGAQGNEDVLYVASGSQVFVRSAAPPASLLRSDAYPGGLVRGIAIDPRNGAIAYVVDQQRVFRTANSGSTWTDVTGNLMQLSPGALQSVAFSTATMPGAVVVGSDRGVFTAPGPMFNAWSAFGAGFPSVPVYQLEYDPADRVLLAGTLGRGAWTMTIPEMTPPAPAPMPAGAAGGGPGGAAPPPQPGPSEATFELRPGVIVDRTRNLAYIMTPAGSTEAIALQSGALVWNSTAAAKPLAVAGGRLVGQADSATNSLRIVMLDPATGKEMLEAIRPLPAGVRASVNETLEGAFVAAAMTTAGDPVVTWEYRDRRKQGVPPDTQDTIVPPTGIPAPASGGAQTRSGAFVINVQNGSSAPADAPGPPPSLVPRTASVPAPERLANAPGQQFFSADRRHVMVSAVNPEGGIWNRYRWTILDHAAGNTVGSLTSHLSHAPFFVNGSQIVYETGPYERGETREPLKVRAADLQSGKELWSRPVRDTVMRTPRPGLEVSRD
jgi:hypothetical protein